MTIAAGFICSDGLVFAADTQYTGITKRHGAKIWWFPCGNTVVVIAGAGIATYIRHVKEEIRKHLKDGMSDDSIIQKANDVIFALSAKHAKVDAEEWELDVLLGICSPSGISLYENQSGCVFSPVETDTKSQCIGCGRSLGTYFTDWLVDSDLTVQWAVTIAAHLLNRTKNLDSDCGGKSHILVVPAASGSAPHFLTPPDIATLEIQLGRIQEAMRDVLVYSPGLNLNPETIMLRFKALEDAVHAARSVTVRVTGVAAAMGMSHVAGAWITPEIAALRPTESDPSKKVEG